MKLKTRLLAPFFILSFFTVNACSLPSINSDINLKNLNINELKINKSNYHINTENPYSIDLGKKGGSSFNFKIKFSKSDFKVKANVSGEVYTADDIDSIKVILFNQSSFSTGEEISTSTTFGPFPISYSNISVGTNNISVNFTNVPGNINPYRVGIQALQGSKIITKEEGIYGKYSGKPYAVSSTGGDDNSGKLTINATNLKFISSGSPATPLGSTLKLIDADGASIESEITITAEPTINLGNIQLVRFYLVNDNSGVITVIPGSFDFTTGTKFGGLKAGTPTTIKFLNIPSGNYRVAAAAYNNTTASSGANITNGTDGLGLGLGNFTLSSNMVTVNSNLVVSSETPLNLSLNLI